MLFRKHLFQPLFHRGAYVNQLLEALPGGISRVEGLLPFFADVSQMRDALLVREPGLAAIDHGDPVHLQVTQP